jgi:hypothetical protein
MARHSSLARDLEGVQLFANAATADKPARPARERCFDRAAIGADEADARDFQRSVAQLARFFEGFEQSCRMVRKALREFAPSPLGCPPKEHAPKENDTCHYQPSVNAAGDGARTKQNDRRDHREIVRAKVAAVDASAPLCIEEARRSHPAQRDDPNSRSNRDRGKQTGKNRGTRYSPREQAHVRASQPIA